MTDVIELIRAHAWEALILWTLAGLLSLALARRSQIDAWAETHPKLAGALKVLRSLGLDPWMLVQGLALLFKGRLPPKLQAEKIVAAKGKPISDEVHEEVMLQSVRPPTMEPPLASAPEFKGNDELTPRKFNK